MEVWKDVVGFEGHYMVSDLGNIKRNKTGRILKATSNRKHKGYLIIGLTVRGHRTTRTVHSIVAQAFLSNPSNKEHVNHKDCNKRNNCADNLEYCTHVENLRHAIANNQKPGRPAKPKPDKAPHKSPKLKLTRDDVLFIRTMWGMYNVSAKTLALTFGMNHRYVYEIINNKRWNSI